MSLRQYFSHPLFLLFCADVTADVGPWNVLGPPHWLAALLPPSRLPSSRWVLQHLWDECSQLGLEWKGTDAWNKEMSHTKTLKLQCVPHAHISTRALEQAAGGAYRSGTCCRVLRLSRPANRNRLSKKENNAIMFNNRPIYGCGSSLMCQTDTMGTSGVIRHSFALHCPGVKRPVLRMWDAQIGFIFSHIVKL